MTFNSILSLSSDIMASNKLSDFSTGNMLFKILAILLCHKTREGKKKKAWSLKRVERVNLEKRCALQWPVDSVFSSPSPRSADGGRWRSTGRQRGSRGSCNKNKPISCLYSTTTGGRTHSSRSSRSTRIGASPASTPQTLSPTTSPLTALERYLLPVLLRH